MGHSDRANGDKRADYVESYRKIDHTNKNLTGENVADIGETEN